jgi:hypothetical protein
MGFGRGRGARGYRFGGGGRRHMFYATGLPGWMRFGDDDAFYRYSAPYRKPDPKLEKQTLKNQAEALQSELDIIKKRLAMVESESAAG